MKPFLLAVVIMIFAALADASTQNCVPKNNRYNPVGNKSIQTLSEAQFKSVIKKVKDIYVPIFKDHYKAELVVEELWDDATENAYAQQFGTKWQVSMFGGLARDPLLTEDGFVGVICHEIGHHLGGAPMVSSWAADEGQADYYAMTHCLKKVFEKEASKNVKNLVRTNLTEDEKLAKKACESVYKSLDEQALCFRSSLAGQSLAAVLASLGEEGKTPMFGTPDPKKVTKTNHAHPVGQCRMDTYWAGALCDINHREWTDKKDASVAACTSKSAHKIGLRPLCWFQPKDYGLDR